MDCKSNYLKPSAHCQFSFISWHFNLKQVIALLLDKIVLFGQQFSEISISKDTAVSKLKHPVTINVTLPQPCVWSVQQNPRILYFWKEIIVLCPQKKNESQRWKSFYLHVTAPLAAPWAWTSKSCVSTQEKRHRHVNLDINQRCYLSFQSKLLTVGEAKPVGIPNRILQTPLPTHFARICQQSSFS